MPVQAAKPPSDDGYRIDRPHAVSDPTYGNILYHYYQRQYFAAMADIQVGLARGTLPEQRNRARVLLGALYASYGMPDAAEAQFRELLAEAVDPELATRIWIYLSDIYYRRAQYQQALDLLDSQVKEPPEDLLLNYLTLRTRILMKLGRYDQTESVLDQLGEEAGIGGYLKYNLAVSRINAGQGAQGTSLLWDLARLPPGSEETNGLKDKAMLALGVHYLRTDQGDKGRALLGAARLEGPYSETAMLLHARAWLASDEPVRAMPSLTALGQRSMQFEEAQEAALARPFLYEKLGDFGRARTAYRDAIAAFTAHYTYLAGLENHIRSGQWFDELVLDTGWSTAMDPLPPFEPARIESFATFRALFATHRFQKYWRDYHEQVRQNNLLASWQQRLPALDELLAAHIRKHRATIPMARDLLAEAKGFSADQRIRQLQGRADGNRENWRVEAFATPDELVLWQKLEEASQLASRWGDRIKPEILAQIELYRGLLEWKVYSDVTPRSWEQTRELQQLDNLVAQHLEYRARVHRATLGDIQRVTDLGYQLAGQHNALSAMERRGEQLRQRLQQGVEQMALDQVQRTRERLQFFTAECWAAMGDLEHRALRARREALRVQPSEALPLASSAVEEGGNKSAE